MTGVEMNCAKCKDTQLQRMRIAGALGAWSCEKCEGIWIPAGKALGAQAPEGLVLANGDIAEADSRAGLCPEGHGLLTRAQTYIEDGFYLERCSACFGVWFDRGEWQRVSAAGMAGGLFEIWTEPWQRARWQEKASDAYAAQLNSRLGEALVEQISALASELREHPSRGLAMGYFLRLLSGE
jgi:Zn-finger nucleic acid-binding protein